jgi:hypothetical protein
MEDARDIMHNAPSAGGPIWEQISRKRVVGRPFAKPCNWPQTKTAMNDYEVIRSHLTYDKHVLEKRMGHTAAG